MLKDASLRQNTSPPKPRGHHGRRGRQTVGARRSEGTCGRNTDPGMAFGSNPELSAVVFACTAAGLRGNIIIL